MTFLLFRTAAAAASTTGRRRSMILGNQRNVSMAPALPLKHRNLKSVNPRASALSSRLATTESRCTPSSTLWIAVNDNKLSLRTRPSFFSSVSSSPLNKDEDDGDDDDDADADTPLQDEIARANARYDQRVVVRGDRATAGWGVFAAADCAAGSVVLEGRTLHPRGAATTQPGAHTIQTSARSHVRMDLPARFLNHACGSGANVGVRLPAATNAANNSNRSKKQPHKDDNNSSGNRWTTVYEFVAKRDIARGEQLRFDYETTEWALQSPFDCACGSTECRGTVAGFKVAVADLQQADRRWIAPHLWVMLDAVGQDNNDVGEQKKK